MLLIKRLSLLRVVLALLAILSSGCVSHLNEWEVVFEDNGQGKWQDNWFVEGKKANIKNTARGMIFSSGPEVNEHASHAVLWSKAQFAGDLKIEYDYTRLDSMTNATSVNILYIHATGTETDTNPKDISKSRALRDIPYMRSYFMNMNLLHISYAATGPALSHYVSARQYPAPTLESFGKATQILPIYQDVSIFEPGETYHITATKVGHHLTFSAERNGETHRFVWNTSKFPPVTNGRIGFRHMWGRSSLYKNLKVYQRSHN